MSSIKVFIAGSRSVSRLNDALRHRLDRIIQEGHEVLVGDANGADRAVQRYLAERGYLAVTVFCSGGICRNNVAQWRTVAVSPPAGVSRGFDFYAAKDREMAAAATHGLMLWDGESRGTLTNISNLLAVEKPAVVYLSPARTFFTIRTQADVSSLIDAARHSGARSKVV